MQYKSTRNSNISISSAEAIKQGLSVEGGLFVPESIPAMTEEEIKALVDMNYRQRAKAILSKFLTDFTDDELDNCINKAYTKEKFGTENIKDIVLKYTLEPSAFVLSKNFILQSFFIS